MSPSASGARSRAGRVAAWVGWWVALMALWLLLVGTLDAPELIVGAAAAAVAASAAVLVLLPGVDRFESELGWLTRAARRLPWASLADTVRLFAALARHLLGRRPLAGRFGTSHFSYGGDDPRDTARRACAKAAGSFAPNVYVIGIDEEHDELHYHELLPASGPAARDPLGLG